MASNPTVLPAVAMNEELAKAISAATSQDEIRAAILAEAEKQAGATAATTAADADTKKKAEEAAAAVVAAAGTQPFKRTETIGGREFEFEASTELELERMISNALKVAYAVQSEAQVEHVDPVAEAAAVEAAAKTEEAKVAALADLELKFKRGEISTATYLEQSGAVADFLAKQGVSIDTLKATVERSQSSQFEQSWAQATEGFLHSAAGEGWPGGARNLQMIGMEVAALNLVDAPDKVAALAQAYNSMKQKRMVFANDDAADTTAAATAAATTVAATTAAAAAATTTAAAAAAAALAKKANTSSSLFGASSGAGATTEIAKLGKDSVVEIPASASPAEIMDAWKKQQLAQGKDPNSAFVETFRRTS